MLAEAQKRVAAGGCAPIWFNAQRVQHDESAQRPPGSVGFGLVVAPVTVGMLAGEQLLRQRLVGSGGSRFPYLGVVGRPVQDVSQCPVNVIKLRLSVVFNRSFCEPNRLETSSKRRPLGHFRGFRSLVYP